MISNCAGQPFFISRRNPPPLGDGFHDQPRRNASPAIRVFDSALPVRHTSTFHQSSAVVANRSTGTPVFTATANLIHSPQVNVGPFVAPTLVGFGLRASDPRLINSA